MKHITTDDLIRDLSIVAEDLEALVQATARNTSEKVTAVRGRLEQLVKTMKKRLLEVEHHVEDKTRSAIKEADTYVREHAWETIAAAAKVGIFVGVLLHKDQNKKS